MAEDTTNELVLKVQEMLKEATWTRASIGNFTKNNLIELAGIVEKARAENCTNELQQLCDDHLSHTKDSIIALYISGMISLYDGALDNSNLVALTDIFQKNHKENLVTYLCDEILSDDPNNKFALRILAESSREAGSDKMWDLYTQIVKLDFEEADMARALADHYEQLALTESDEEKSKKLMKESISYYRKALLRYIAAKNINSVKDVWSKLVQLIPEEIDFFTLAKNKIAKTISEGRSIDLMKELYEWYKNNKLWESNKKLLDTAIDILKQNLEIDPMDKWTRKELVECYREKYADRANMEDFIRQSNLTQDFRNVFEAINDFEKHIAFDKGSYVYHRQWHVGKIKKVENDTLTINFGKKNGVRPMSLKMAVQALTPLTEDHIWVLKATKKREDLAKQIKDDKVWALKTIIKSFDNNCDLKRIKAELVSQTNPAASILKPSEWTSWNTAAKKILASDPAFSVNPNDASFYTVRARELNQEEKLSNEFKAQKQFYPRIDILLKYIENDECDRTSESFNEMLSYFTGYLKAPQKIGEQEIVAYLILEHITSIDKNIIVPVKYSFGELYSKIEDPREIYKLLKDSKNAELRHDFLAKIKLLPKWADEYVRLFPVSPEKEILSTLIANDHADKVKKLVQDCFENYRANRSAVIFFFKECREEEWYKEVEATSVPYEKQLIALVSIIEQNFREINNHVNTTENKKLNKNASDLLFGGEKKTDKDGAFITHILEKLENNCDDEVTRLYTLVSDISDLDGAYTYKLRSKIREKREDFKFPMTEEKGAEQHHGMIVTAKKLEEKEERLKILQTVEIPENAKEVGEARAKGDLKENAEYSAAREKQHMLNLEQTKLQEEINRAVVFDQTTVNTSVVSFGTKVTLHNNISGSDDTFIILGPWESDPANGIFSYMSPLGSELLDLRPEENATFTINETNYDYTVKSIEVAKI